MKNLVKCLHPKRPDSLGTEVYINPDDVACLYQGTHPFAGFNVDKWTIVKLRCGYEFFMSETIEEAKDIIEKEL